MLNNRLRLWAIVSQALGLVTIFLLETLLGRGQAGSYQLVVLLLMLVAALVIAVLRRYHQRKARRLEEQRFAELREDEADD
ncbi:hypothetical protein [Marinospirillum minutulum]|uniref:hypothetical protein n=1 Tax=Marinospirillum minutulum TaxID=64974 RepID=UPI0004048F12|nr:hypothetical protein [Marinospirillum minutulum]